MHIIESTPHILVIGDVMLDHYLWGKCDRISPEAPVQVIDIKKESTLLGGAGNVINNLITLGAEVSVATVVGNDDNGEVLLDMLNSLGVKTSVCIKETGRITSRKSRIIAAHQQVIRFDSETKVNIGTESETTLLRNIAEYITSFDLIILSDYAKGVLTDSICQEVITLARKSGIKVLVDPKGNDYSKYKGAYLLTPNKKEASQATGIDIIDTETLTKALDWLKTHVALDIPMITLSEDGIAFFDDSLHHISTVAQEVYDVTGAGDTVIAALGFALTQNKNLYDAVMFANAAAAVVVGKLGSATATMSEIVEYETSLKQTHADSRIKTHTQIEHLVQNLKERGKRIVFTNGCFDLLHVGHVRYLEEAKSFGDVLILGLNSDASVRVLKGENRPINTENDRAYVLAALESVDYVVIFDDDTPYELIKRVKPDILVKGGDYEGKEVVGSDIAKETRLVQFVEGKSTTSTICKIKEHA
jgi:D-beta-D-heptose 7-phosphate kinase/D-beta-D-heptose 1-phosphate adenosyltransferase